MSEPWKRGDVVANDGMEECAPNKYLTVVSSENGHVHVEKYGWGGTEAPQEFLETARGFYKVEGVEPDQKALDYFSK